MSTSYADRYEVDLSQIPLFDASLRSLQIYGESYPCTESHFLASLLTELWKGAQVLVPDVCSICLEDCIDTSAFRQLPCHHIFHQPCIDKWICNKDTRCPLCNQRFDNLRKPRQPAAHVGPRSRVTAQTTPRRLSSWRKWWRRIHGLDEDYFHVYE